MNNYYVGIILLIFVSSCRPGTKEESIQPILSTITESVYASAKVVPKDSYLSRSIRSGIIQKIYVEEGSKVNKGQSLFKISPTPDVDNKIKSADINLAEAKENYSGENSRLNNIKNEINRLVEKNHFDSLNYTRKQKLWNQNIGSKNELESAKIAYSASTSQLQNMKEQYDQTKLNLKNNVTKAQNLAKTEKDLLSDYLIKSELEGYIFKIYKQEGEYISPQENFAEIGSDSEYTINMDIDESDITKINIGDTTLINLEAYQGEIFTAVISYISKIKNERTQTFNVESVFIDTPTKLYNGLSGEANIVVDQRENALTIPAEYLLGRNKVMTADGERIVKVGMKNLKFVEVLEGIDTLTNIIKPE